MRVPSSASFHVRNALIASLLTLAIDRAATADWLGYAGDPQHTALSAVASQPLGFIKWQSPVDLQPQYSGDELLIHYGSPMVTAGNTLILPVKTGASGGFQISAFDATDGTPKWTQTTDYTLPPNGAGWPAYFWTPSYGPTLTPAGQLYYPGAGGTIYSRGLLDASGAAAPTQLAFYGIANYTANPSAFNADIAISTPITSDAQGNIYFGYETPGVVLPGVNNGQPLTSGIARISSTGVGSFFQAQNLQVNGSPAGMTQIQMNGAPALSNDGTTVYVTMSNGSAGRLVALNSATLTPTASVALIDPKTGTNDPVINISTATPMVGPDGDVYMGTLDNAGTSRGWMHHYSADLSMTKPTGGFGWDATASVVPASMVPSYHGSSSYLILTKYNNYASTGGDGVNMLAILDPNDDSQIDSRSNSTGIAIMKQILTIAGPTPDAEFLATHPDAVREWCINTAAVDPATDSVLVNNEDGSLYRWNLATNTLTQAIALTSGLGEAYTPTLIGTDGTVYAINNATLFAVGTKSFPAVWNGSSGNWSDSANWSTGPQAPSNNSPLGALYNVSINAGSISLNMNPIVSTLALAHTSGTYSATLDLADHKLILQSTDPADKASKIADLNAAIASGSNNAIWTGAGITSSAAAADSAHYAVGVFDNALLNLTSFGGQPVDANSILLTIVHLGDANDNGIVDIQDLTLVANNWQTAQNNWAAGDLNRDGIVDIQDFTMVANNWQQTSNFPLDPSGLTSQDSRPTNVPEPTSLLLLTLLTPTLLRRRNTSKVAETRLL